MTIIGHYLKEKIKLKMCYHLSFWFITKHFVDWNIITHLEPINCTATNQGWKHAKSIPEGISNGTHGQYYMKVLFNTVNEEIIHCKRGGINFFSLKLNKLKKYKCTYNNVQEKWQNILYFHKIYFFLHDNQETFCINNKYIVIIIITEWKCSTPTKCHWGINI